MINDKADEVIEKFFKSLLNRHQNNLEKPMRGTYFIFDCVNLFYYKFHKINFKQGGSNINSPDWIKNKKATIKSIKKTINAFNTL